MNQRLKVLLEHYKKDPYDTFTLYGIALEYLSAKDYIKAEIFFKQLLKLNPSYVPAFMQYARLKEEADAVEEAKKIYIEGIKIAKEKGDERSAREMEDFLNELE